MIWRTKVQAKVKGKGPTQGFNLLQNESKLVPRKFDPCLKGGLLYVHPNLQVPCVDFTFPQLNSLKWKKKKEKKVKT
jgi:hypothetical protein